MKGRVYKIFYKDVVYIGSTFKTLNKRWRTHISDYKKKMEVSLYKYFDMYKAYNFRICLLKEYEVADKKNLTAYEQLWINKLNCVNRNNALRLLSKEYFKQYYQDNKERVAEYHKQYYQDNREEILDKQKQYYQDNREEIREYKKERVVCDCGEHISRMHIARHKKTLKHLNSLALIKN